MTRDEQIAALRAVAPFDRISDDGLALLLEVVEVRSYAPGAAVRGGASASPRLDIVIAGGVQEASGGSDGPVIGLAGMFAEGPATPLSAHPEAGATLVSIDRQTFFTLARASPELVRGFLDIGPAGGAAG